jgi:hypothetical protein
MKKLLNFMLASLLLTGCTSQKDCTEYKTQIEACKTDLIQSKNQIEILETDNIKLIKSVDDLKKEVNILVNDLNLCEEISGNYTETIKKLYDSILGLNSQIENQKELLIYYLDRVDKALFFIEDTFSIGDEKFFVINRGIDIDTIKIYHSESIYWIVNYLFKNDTITRYKNDFINLQETEGHVVLILDAEGTFCQGFYPILAVNVNDTLYCRTIINHESPILVHILRSYNDIDNISLEFINDAADSTCDRNVIINSVILNRMEMDSIELISPAKIVNDKIRLNHSGAKIIITP